MIEERSLGVKAHYYSIVERNVNMVDNFNEWMDYDSKLNDFRSINKGKWRYFLINYIVSVFFFNCYRNIQKTLKLYLD